MTVKYKIAFGQNAKVGQGLVTSATRATCPASCPLLGICYGEQWPLRDHWTRFEKTGMGRVEFIEALKRAPAGVVARGKQVGDFEHLDGEMDLDRCVEEARAMAANGRRAFTFTHHDLTPGNVTAIRAMISEGYTVRVSCNSLDHAARVNRDFPDLPLAVLLRKGEVPGRVNGIPVIVCPAQRSKAVSCAGGTVRRNYNKGQHKAETYPCGGAGGPLCWRHDTESPHIIGFWAHAKRKAVEAVIDDWSE